MNRIDLFLARRILTGVAGVVIVFFGLIALSESLDAGKLEWLAETQGQNAAILYVIGSAARWSIKALPVTALIGAIVALLALQNNRELLVIKASGISIWQMLRGPVIAMLVGSAAVAILLDSAVTQLNRSILPAPQSSGTTVGADDEIWLEQAIGPDRFIIQAKRALPGRQGLEDVVVFQPAGASIRRIEADRAELSSGLWTFTNAKLVEANQPVRYAEQFTLETDSSLADLELKLSSAEDFTFFELASALASGVRDPAVEAAAATRFFKLMSLPFLLVGTLLIAFAFTAGYRRTSSYGGAILYGIALGFVVFVTNEMADRAGSAGVLDPTLAAWGPALVAIVIGLTVLLYKEDGRHTSAPRGK